MHLDYCNRLLGGASGVASGGQPPWAPVVRGCQRGKMGSGCQNSLLHHCSPRVLNFLAKPLGGAPDFLFSQLVVVVVVVVVEITLLTSILSGITIIHLLGLSIGLVIPDFVTDSSYSVTLSITAISNFRRSMRTGVRRG